MSVGAWLWILGSPFCSWLAAGGQRPLYLPRQEGMVHGRSGSSLGGKSSGEAGRTLSPELPRFSAGAVNGKITPAPDRLGDADSATSFAGGADCYIGVADTPKLQITSELALAAWMLPDKANANNSQIYIHDVQLLRLISAKP